MAFLVNSLRFLTSVYVMAVAITCIVLFVQRKNVDNQFNAFFEDLKKNQ